MSSDTARRRTLVVTIAACGLAASLAAAATERPLTLAEAQRIALAESPQLKAQGAAVAAANAVAVAAGQMPDPVLRLSLENVPSDGPDGWSLTRDPMTMRRIGVMQEITSADKRSARAERGLREVDRLRVEEEVMAASIRHDVTLAWLDRYYASAALAIVDADRIEARSAVEAAEAAYRGGRGSQSDIHAARLAAIGVEDRATEWRRRDASARAALARYVGEAANAPLAGAPSLSGARGDAGTLEATIAQTPQIVVLARQEDVAEAEARVATLNRDPDWSVEVAYAVRGPSYSNMVSVGVSVPLPWDRPQRQDRELAAKLAQRDQARALREERLRGRVAEASAAMAARESARERLERYRTEVLPITDDRARAALAAYRGGKGSLADVLAARRAELEARLALLDIEQQQARAQAELDHLYFEPAAHAAARPEGTKP
jgi:outer membrane protein TolC